MHHGELSAAEVMVCSKSPAYLRGDHKMKSWEVRGGALLRVSFIIADIELWKAKTHTAYIQDTSLRHDLTPMLTLLAHMHQSVWSIPCFVQHCQQNCRVTFSVQLCKIWRVSSPFRGTWVNTQRLIKRQGWCFSISTCLCDSQLAVVIHLLITWIM